MMNFTGFGLNYDPPLVPGVLAPLPSLPFFTLSDGMVVPVESGVLGPSATDLSPAGPAPYEGQVPHSATCPPSGDAEGAPVPGQRPVTIPAAQPRPCTVLKIRRPPNAFMVFANEHRKILAKAFPTENNQSISVRLGSMWKAMPEEQKSVYYQVAKEAAAEHKRLYPSYVYSPKEARMRKQAREQVRREKAVKPVGVSCEGGTPSTETRAKLMEVAQLLDSISSDRLPHHSRRRPGFPVSDGGPLTAEADSSSPVSAADDADGAAGSPSRPASTPFGASSHIDEKAAENQPLHDPSGPHGTHGSQGGRSTPLAPHHSAVRGQLYHTVSTAHGRDVHWTVLPHSQVSCGPVPPLSPGSGAGGGAARGGVHPYPGPPVYRDLATGRPASLVGYGSSGPVDGHGPYQPMVGLLEGGSCLLRGAPVRGEQPSSTQHWSAAPAAAAAASTSRPGLIHHHHHHLHHLHHGGNLLRHGLETACPPQLVSIAPPTWPVHARTPALSVESPSLPRARAAHATVSQPRHQQFCLHFLAAGSCGHCRPAACCETPPATCQCHCSAVLSSHQQQAQHLEGPQLGQPAVSPVRHTQCAAAAAGTPRGPVVHPAQCERYRRQPVQLRIPDPRSTQGLHDPPAVDLRSGWRAVSVTSLAGTPPDGSPLWGSPPPAAYLRSTHSPNIEELVGASTNPLSL